MKRRQLAASLAAFSLFASCTWIPNIAKAASALGDLSGLKAIVMDVQAIAATGNLAKASQRITDFETAWDNDEPRLKPMDKQAWHHIDDAADAALKALRAKKPESPEVTSTLTALAAAIDNP